MESTDVAKRLTPCGLDCERCADYDHGEIRRLSLRLLELLGNYQRVAKLKASGRPEFEHYGEFDKILRLFSQGACGGCRSDKLQCPIACPFENCRGKGIDFCFQCPDYPCEKLSAGPFGENVRRRNDRLKEIGIIPYFEERMNEPRYPK